MHRHTQPSKLPILYLLNSAFICLIRRGPETPQWPTLYSNNWKLKCPKCQSSLCLIGWCNTVVFLLYKKQFKKAHSTLNMQVFRGWSIVQKSHHDKAISYYTNFNIKKHLQDKTYIYLEQPKNFLWQLYTEQSPPFKKTTAIIQSNDFKCTSFSEVFSIVFYNHVLKIILLHILANYLLAFANTLMSQSNYIWLFHTVFSKCI